MLALAKRTARLLAERSRWIVAFWLISNFLLVNTCIIIFMNNTTYEYGYRNGSEIDRRGFEEELESGISILLIPSLVLLLVSRSILIVFSTSMASLQSICIFSISRNFFPQFEVSISYQLSILLFISTANTVAARKCWERYRRGPSESTIGRLLLSSVDKSLPLVIGMTTMSSLIPLITMTSMRMTSFPQALLFSSVNIVQNLCAVSIVFSMLLIRHNSNIVLPSTTVWMIRTWEALVDGKLIYIAHFLCRVGHWLLFSPLKIPYVLFYIMLIVAFLAGMIFRTIINIGSNPIGFDVALMCKTTACWKENLYGFSLLLLPLIFHLVVSKIRINTLIGMLLICFSMGGYFLSVDIFHLPFKSTDLQVILATIIPLDSSIRLCMAFQGSRKKRNSSRVLDSLDGVFSQVTIAILTCMASFIISGILDGNMVELLPILSILSTSWISFLFFMPAAMVLLGVMCSCGPTRRESQQSESRSIYTDKASAQFMFDQPDYTRRYSSVNYYGTGKQRKSLVAVSSDETRRASMPVGVRHKIIMSGERWKSIDCGTSSSSVTKREAFLRSQAESMISDVIILEE